ncbi:MAG: hypothetical protein AB1485_00525, partial [Candidatus Thermoplasmatota archaeon]
NEEGPRIPRVNPDLRDYFSKLVLPQNKHTLKEFLDGYIDWDECVRYIKKEEIISPKTSAEILSTIGDFTEYVQKLPTAMLLDKKKSSIKILTKLKKAVEKQLDFLKR